MTTRALRRARVPSPTRDSGILPRRSSGRASARRCGGHHRTRTPPCTQPRMRRCAQRGGDTSRQAGFDRVKAAPIVPAQRRVGSQALRAQARLELRIAFMRRIRIIDRRRDVAEESRYTRRVVARNLRPQRAGQLGWPADAGCAGNGSTAAWGSVRCAVGLRPHDLESLRRPSHADATSPAGTAWCLSASTISGATSSGPAKPDAVVMRTAPAAAPNEGP
jgi:hypothetical protein